MLDAILDLIEKKKISGKDLPTEVFIKKKCTSAMVYFLLSLSSERVLMDRSGILQRETSAQRW